MENVKRTIAFGMFEKKHPDTSLKSPPPVKRRRSSAARSSPVKRTRRSSRDNLDKSFDESEQEPEKIEEIKLDDDPPKEEPVVIEPVQNGAEPSSSSSSSASSVSEPVEEVVTTAKQSEASENLPQDMESEPEVISEPTASKEAPSNLAPGSPTVSARSSETAMIGFNSPVDLGRIDRKRPDKNLTPECIWSLFTHKQSGKQYCLVKWKNSAGVQMLNVDSVRQQHPQLLIDFLLSERK